MATIYIASKTLRGPRAKCAEVGSDKFYQIDVTASQGLTGKAGENRRDFSTMTSIEGGYKGYCCFENYWQAGKVFEGVDREKQLKWWMAQDSGKRKYPLAKSARVIYSQFGDGEKLGYIASRKRVYVPEYIKLVKDRTSMQKAKMEIKKGKPVIIYDSDGPKSANGENICEKVTLEMLINKINDPRHPFGHGYIVAAELAGIDWKSYTTPAPGDDDKSFDQNESVSDSDIDSTIIGTLPKPGGVVRANPAPSPSCSILNAGGAACGNEKPIPDIEENITRRIATMTAPRHTGTTAAPIVATSPSRFAGGALLDDDDKINSNDGAAAAEGITVATVSSSAFDDLLPPYAPPGVTRSITPVSASEAAARVERRIVSSSPLPPPNSSPRRQSKSYSVWASGLPVPSAMAKKNANVWKTEFSGYIARLLEIVYTSRKIINEITSDNILMDVFRRGVTDPTFAADNYETLETIGDKALGYAFSKHVYSRLGANVTEKELSSYNSYYMSKRYQSVLSTEMKMFEWLLYRGEEPLETVATASIREDVFESLTAALDLVATEVHQRRVKVGDYKGAVMDAPASSEIVRRFIDYIFDAKGIDPEFALGAAKTTLLEVGTLFGMRKSNITFESPPEGTPNAKHNVYVPEPLRVALVEAGINLPSTLASGFPDKNQAAEAAMALARSVGLTEDWIANKRHLMRAEFLGKELRSQLETRLRARGIRKFLFKTPTSHEQPDGRFTVILVGVRDDDSQVVVESESGYSATSTTEAVVRKFLSSSS